MGSNQRIDRGMTFIGKNALGSLIPLKKHLWLRGQALSYGIVNHFSVMPNPKSEVFWSIVQGREGLPVGIAQDRG